MSSSTYTYNQTFTITHAKYLASKLAADLKRVQRLYGSPSDSSISSYEQEMTQLLKAGYLDEVKYGFKYNGNFVEPTLIYSAQDLAGANSTDDDPGKIKPGADISGAKFSSFLSYSSSWFELSRKEQVEFEKFLPFKRTEAAEPGINGYLAQDKTYSNGGVSLNRSSVKSY